MKHVELVRERLARGLDRCVKDFLTWLSCTDGNLLETDALRAALQRTELKPEPELIAKLTEVVLEHLGHKTQINGQHVESKARRVANRL